MTFKFRLHENELAIVRLDADASVPAWVAGDGFVSVTRTPNELSIVCDASRVPADLRHERGWVMLELEGPFPFELTGILVSFIAPLADAKVGIFAMSTFDTDVVLVKRVSIDAALAALARAGHLLVG